jgi:hypothetical protein
MENEQEIYEELAKWRWWECAPNTHARVVHNV